MISEIKQLIQSFESDSKIPKKRYADFLAHVYTIFDKYISLSKTDKMMNKYRKTRASILQYIVTKEREITTEICKSK